MFEEMPRTPFSTPLSGSAKETEIRIRNIMSGPKKRPPVLFLALMFSVCIFCGNLVSCQVKETEAPNAGASSSLADLPDPPEQKLEMEIQEHQVVLQDEDADLDGDGLADTVTATTRFDPQDESGSTIITLTAALGRDVEAANASMAEQALRVLACGYQDIESLPEPSGSAQLETGLTFVGLVGMIDPPRLEVKDAVGQCYAAGIRPVMITGDHKLTAVAIARELDIFRSGDLAITGEDLDFMPQELLEQDVDKFAVYARVSPEHKMRIVKAWQKKGMVVAMTGDGVNDAPALKVADIGCAMGITGTDVAKGAADMILTDDNFATIVKAVEQGRGIYSNIKKAIHYLLSCNIGEIVALFLATISPMLQESR